MAQDMTYAQALNEARQVIIQQQHRIKADAEKIKLQQQTILDQSSALSEGDRRMKEQGSELERLVEELGAAESRLNELTTAKQQAEAVVDRQGERLTTQNATLAQLEQRSNEQSDQIAELTSERNALRLQLPSPEDVDALASMSELLSRRPRNAVSATPMRLSTDSQSDSPLQTEAA